MRLLIVEDEYYTRQGILDELDLQGIGIDDVSEADDGVNALAVAASTPPDIVLADVRMPRMDGVAMCFELQKSFPDCRIIFMSGHADKEYLKAAIELSAVSYLEKPFRGSELREVLSRAVASLRRERERIRKEVELRARADAGEPFLRSEIALMLVEPEPDLPRIERMLSASGLCVAAGSLVAVALVKAASGSFPENTALRETFLHAVEKLTGESTIGGIAAFKGDGHAVIVFFTQRADRRRFLESGLEGLVKRLFLAMPDVPMLAGIGGVASGAPGARVSYLQASSALDAAFFLGAGQICTAAGVAAATGVAGASAALDAGRGAHEEPPTAPVASALDADAFIALLDRDDYEGAAAFLQAAAAALRDSGSRSPRRARDVFSGLMTALGAYALRKGVGILQAGETDRDLLDGVERCGTLGAVESLCEEKLALVIQRLRALRDDGRLVADIKRFIHRSFASPDLSIEGISREVKLSAAYVCRLFKEAAGQTVHSYITQYRLERARELLSDRKLPKMSEVASRTGFADANYFARVFRKATGLTPSQYREHALS